MLTLPTNFENDIQSRDTNLVPVVIIGNYIQDTGVYMNISTNAGDLLPASGRIFKPLLLNVPSLKESIDIEKRNYKISNVTLNLSNAIYDGERFSETVATLYGSLINQEVRIFWVSPSTTDIAFYDVTGSYGDDVRAFQVYYGVIRKYEHTDEKVKLSIEDRSQSKLHRDLPESLGSSDTILNKYKNKPIPMVYGQVPHSPTIKKINDEGIISVHADREDSGISWGGGSFDGSGDFVGATLFTYKNDRYVTIPATHSDMSTGYNFNSSRQYNATAGNPYIEFESAIIEDPQQGLGGGTLFDPLSPLSINSLLITESSDYIGSSGDPLENVQVSYSEPYGRNFTFPNAVTDRPKNIEIDPGDGSDPVIFSYNQAFVTITISFQYSWTNTVLTSPTVTMSYFLGSGQGKKLIQHLTVSGDITSALMVNTFDGIEYKEGEEGYYNSLLLGIERSANEGYGDHSFTDIWTFDRVVVSLVKDADELDIYASVVGRLPFPNAPQIINHIVANELYDATDNPLPGYNYTTNIGEMNTQNYTSAQYDDWVYGFTVNKKINSLKYK